MEASDSVIRKIQKLLSMAAGAEGNEAEATLAMARAQELLAVYNLDYAMVAAANVAGGTVAAAPEKREQTDISRSAKMEWQRDLWRTIAEANFCHHWIIYRYEGKRGVGKRSKVAVKRHAVLGRVSNVMAVRLMGEYLEDTIERMLPYPNNERMSRSANSWKAGAADRLCERIREQAEKRMDAPLPVANKNSKALTLRTFSDAEWAANYDARRGEGAWARKLLRDAEWEAGQIEREQRAAEETAKAEREWLEYLQNETPDQKQAREKKEAKERREEERREARRRPRRYSYRETYDARSADSSAYTAGAKAGNKISLAAQVGKGEEKKRLK